MWEEGDLKGEDAKNKAKYLCTMHENSHKNIAFANKKEVIIHTITTICMKYFARDFVLLSESIFNLLLS